jgi:hypothetical protein
LDEVAMASLDQAFSRRFVDLVHGEGRVLAQIEQGALHASGELLKVCAAEETPGRWMMPLPSTGWCDTFFLGGVLGNLQFLILASLITCFQVLNFEISRKAVENPCAYLGS